MIEYTTRYSDTDKPDDMGRWARKAMFKDLCIGWINRHDIKGDIKFLAHTFFPSTSNDRPEASAVKDSYEDAQFFIENEWAKFLEKIK